jgi:hypothetical protein
MIVRSMTPRQWEWSSVDPRTGMEVMSYIKVIAYTGSQTLVL